MDQVQFWVLIEEARAASPNDVASRLVEVLAQRDDRDIMLWDQIFWEYRRLSYKSKLWAAAYVINGGCSDDGFDYFRGWLTAEGKVTFLAALADPDSLAALDVEMEGAEYEDMLGVGRNAYFKKHGMIQRDYDALDTARQAFPLSNEMKAAMREEIHYADDIDAEWSEDAPELIVPKLGEKFG